ncbi:hypothetical protein, partial [Mesorhizobium sp.]|uniref:hypothetical protein n=1 Tax=Mesorhizobium sp. TaxID=1871066 RepID=UPI0025D1D690
GKTTTAASTMTAGSRSSNGGEGLQPFMSIRFWLVPGHRRPPSASWDQDKACCAWFKKSRGAALR